MKLKRLLISTLSAIMICTTPATAYATEFTDENELLSEYEVTEAKTKASGKCGENLTWTLNDKILTISGKGDMYNYRYGAGWPNTTSITKIVLSDGITSLGNWAFAYCESVKNIKIPNGVKSIGLRTFLSCTSLKEITIPNTVTSIGNFAFEGCSNLRTIYYNGSKTQWNSIIGFSSIPNGCQVIFNSHTHGWSSWKTTKKATVLATGKKERTCSGCGKKETKTIAKLTPTGKLTYTTLTLKEKQTSNAIKATGLAYGDKVKSYTSNNKNIFTVNKTNGKITAKAKGTAKLTVTLASGKKLTATIKVQTNTVKTSKLTVNKTSVTLTKGKTFQLKVTKSPITSQEKITYTSNKKSVATVTSTGKIKAQSKGTAYITIKSGSKSVKVKVTVK